MVVLNETVDLTDGVDEQRLFDYTWLLKSVKMLDRELAAGLIKVEAEDLLVLFAHFFQSA